MRRILFSYLLIAASGVGFTARSEAVSYILDPASGSEMKMISDITIKFPGQEIYFREGTEDDPTIRLNLGDKEWICNSPTLIDDQDGYTYKISSFTSDWDYPVNQSGEYFLAIKEMYKIVDGNEIDIDDITATYKIPYDFDFVLDPPVDNAQNLQGLSITFPGLDVKYVQNSRLGIATLQGPRNTYKCIVPSRKYDPEVGTTLTFTFIDSYSTNDNVPETISEPGTYLLTIRDVISSVYLGQIYVYYQLPSGNADAVYHMKEGTVMEPKGNFLSYMPDVLINYDTPVLELVSSTPAEDEWSEPESTLSATLSIEGYDDVFSLRTFVRTILPGSGRMDAADDDLQEAFDVLALDPASVYEHFDWEIPYGLYTVNIPEGIVANADGEINPSQKLVFHIMENTGFNEPQITPPRYDEDTFMPIEYLASDLESICVSWGQSLTFNDLTINATCGPDTFPPSNDVTPLYYGIDIALNDLSDALVIDLSFVEPGQWAVTIPEGYVFVGEGNNIINAECTFSYIVVENKDTTALDIIEKDETGLYKVYDLSGNNVLITSDSSEIMAVGKGLYIVNGKKVLIR